MTRDKRGGGKDGGRDRRGETLFIDARKLGATESRVLRTLTDSDTGQIAGQYHAWRGATGAGTYIDVPGFAKSATLDEIKGHNYVLTPGRYVGAADIEDEDEPFGDKMAQLDEQFIESARLEKTIRTQLQGLGLDA